MPDPQTPRPLSVLTFNLNAPSRERAGRQLDWLAARTEDVLVLTETVDSTGCAWLAERFTAAGYHVAAPVPEGRERGVMIVSRLAARRVTDWKIGYLPHRAVSVVVDTGTGPLEITGLYVPSRDATEPKIIRKRDFLAECRAAIPLASPPHQRMVIGDFNILEPDHQPSYPFFQPFEYDFYRWLGEMGMVDAFRHLHPTATEYTWVGRTGDGYRYDHAHVSGPLAARVTRCHYVHETRTGPDRLTDHSALSVHLAVTASSPLLVSDPTTAADPGALF